jgi:hypothetical protein
MASRGKRSQRQIAADASNISHGKTFLVISFTERLGTDNNCSCSVVRLGGWDVEMPDLMKGMREWQLQGEGIDSRLLDRDESCKERRCFL